MNTFNVPSGFVEFKIENGLCLTESGRGKQISIQKCVKKSNQLWKFKKLRADVYQVISKAGQVLTNQQSLNKNGNPLISWENTNGKNQEWNVIPLPNGRFLFRNPEAAKCIDLDGNMKINTKNNLYECSNDKKTQWIKIRSAEGLPLKLTKEQKMKLLKEKAKCKGRNGNGNNGPKSIFGVGNGNGNGNNGNGNGNGNGDGDCHGDCDCKKKEPKEDPKAFVAPKGWVNIVGKKNFA